VPLFLGPDATHHRSIGNIYLQLKDELGSVYEDEAFAHLFPQRGQPSASPWKLALTTVDLTLRVIGPCSTWKACLTDKRLMRLEAELTGSMLWSYY
jgi:transposase